MPGKAPSEFPSSGLLQLGIGTLCLNLILVIIKLTTGHMGNSQALIADGLESASDIIVSLVTWGGFMLSLRPPDKNHPFGHGKIESLTGLFSGLFLIVAALGIAAVSVREINDLSHEVPSWYTLPVLLLVVAAKEFVFRKIERYSDDHKSCALAGEAWHHRSDAITSAAAALGISIALIGGTDWATADDWAALVACVFIAFNGTRIIRLSLHDALDGNVETGFIESLKGQANQHVDVLRVEKCRVRKSGVDYFLELHLQVDPEMSVLKGHDLGHQVKDNLMKAHANLRDVVVHLEPYAGQHPD
ncbi:cation transporter [Puniceicoccales bacterium CK1056]|uniref:Cation transporter n=1 Tax=Oceanipulchritudo coccoides TaxID=2706888 RepID=A0A6B2M0I7_9BACT|nr:cation diffusion facilitator family transporter [Oceanipulchritudo coccoides]NDV61902.1 cation transporter [Oceanipulchritudo coccoides]